MEKLESIRVFESSSGVKELVIQLDGGGASVAFRPFSTAEDVVRNLHILAKLIQDGVKDRLPRRKAPWNDFAGNEIYEGDVIQHPDGMTGAVVYQSLAKEAEDQWRVDYREAGLSRLCLQIGDKGRATVVLSLRTI